MGKPLPVRKQESIYAFILRYKAAHDGNSPSIREIGRACRVYSTSHVHYCLVRLEMDGKIKLVRGARSIEVIGGVWSGPELEQ
jgi:SOS-response transcriptional repressor LexA